METTKCMCGRTIPAEEHTGRCQLDHFISYTGLDSTNETELKRIIDAIVKDDIEALNVQYQNEYVNGGREKDALDHLVKWIRNKS